MDANERKCLFLSVVKPAEVLVLTRGCHSPCAFTMERSLEPCCRSSRSKSPTEPHSAKDLKKTTQKKSILKMPFTDFETLVGGLF